MSAVGTTPAVTPRRRSFVFLRPARRDAPPAGGTSRGERRLTPRWLPYALSSPALLVMAAIIGFPLVITFVFSFQDYHTFQLIQGLPGRWVGFGNYQYLVSSGQLAPVLLRTLLFTIACVGLTLFIGFGFALLLRRTSRWAQTLLTVSLVAVWAMPTLASTEIYIQLFNPAYGPVAWFLAHLGINYPNAAHDWYASGETMLEVSTFMVVWGAVPFVTVCIFGGLLQIPNELYEAARVDGAGFFAQLRLITIPLLLPIVLLLTVLSVIWDSTVFTQVYVLEQTGGIFTQSDVIGVFQYNIGIGAGDYGAGAAVGVIIVLLLTVISFFAVREMVKSTGPA